MTLVGIKTKPNMKNVRINQNIKVILKIYLLVLSVFSIFRLILFFTETDRLDFNELPLFTIFSSFVMGIRFDIVISGYILFFPALILFILDIVKKNSKIINKIIFYWIFIFFTIAFIISSADIPYFNQFYDRFSIGAFEWIENFDFVLSMIIQEPKYFIIIIPFLIIEVLFFLLLKQIFTEKHKIIYAATWLRISLPIIVLSFMFLGVRGRIQKKSPIRVGTAYFSDNSFLNKLGLNPVFTLMRSYLDSKDGRNKSINIMDEELAINNVQKYLKIKSPKYQSPIARKIVPDTISEAKPNIILIIMESMSAAKMERHGNKNKLTPFLDSLSNNSLYFENIYTSGKHTFNGIFSTLFSFPALYRQHTMKSIRKYDGISSLLLKRGYSTTYFTTHDSQFDNVEGFLRANDFQNIISQLDYPMNEVKTTLGVPDDYMFRYSIPKINELSKNSNPFFVTFMTASDHGPYYIPDYFHPKSKEVKQQIIEYADWSLKKFLTLSAKQKWFNNTIFVFVADHGAPLSAVYDISLNYFHTPLIFYAPEIIQTNKVRKEIGSQIDIYPTIMGLIKQPYINNTLGIDLLNEKRKYAIINDDDKIGIIDTTYFCIMRGKNEPPKLYRYKEKDIINYFNQEKKKANDMVEYAKSNLQTYQAMILNGEITLHNN